MTNSEALREAINDVKAKRTKLDRRMVSIFGEGGADAEMIELRHALNRLERIAARLS